MGPREVIIVLLIVCNIHPVMSLRSAPPCSPSPPQLPYSHLNSCPDHLTLRSIACTSPRVEPAPPPPDDGGDLGPVAGTKSGGQELITVTFAEAVVRAFSAAREEGGMRWGGLFVLSFRVAVSAIFHSEIPVRGFFRRLALKKLIAVLFVNATMAFLLPAEWMWFPAVCCLSSLLAFIVAPRLR